MQIIEDISNLRILVGGKKVLFLKSGDYNMAYRVFDKHLKELDKKTSDGVYVGQIEDFKSKLYSDSEHFLFRGVPIVRDRRHRENRN